MTLSPRSLALRTVHPKGSKSIHVHMTDVYTYSEMTPDIRCRLADANREIYLRNTAVRHMQLISHEHVVILGQLNLASRPPSPATPFSVAGVGEQLRL